MSNQTNAKTQNAEYIYCVTSGCDIKVCRKGETPKNKIKSVKLIPYCDDCYKAYKKEFCLDRQCEKCDSDVPEKYLIFANPPDDMWVECTCGAHSGWYCPEHSPGNDCWDDEKCDCCNP